MRSASRIFLTAIATALCYPVAASAQQQPSVLTELFCNINCGNCPAPDSKYETYRSIHPNVIVINYHNSTTDNQEPFFVASFPYSQQRDQFYGGSGGLSDPSGYIDGIFGSNESVWEALSNADAGKALPISPTVAYGPNGIDTINFTVTGSASVQVSAAVAIKESQVYFVNDKDYGPTPGNLWNDIFRTTLTPAGGTNFNLNGTHTFSVVYDSSIYQYAGNFQNMTAVVFIQDVSPSTPSNNNSHQVEAVGQLSLAPLSGVSETSPSSDQLILPENPLPPNGEFQFELAKAGDVRISVYDLLGREVRTLLDGAMPAGKTTVDVSGASLSSGVYIVRMLVDGEAVDQKKFVVR